MPRGAVAEVDWNKPLRAEHCLSSPSSPNFDPLVVCSSYIELDVCHEDLAGGSRSIHNIQRLERRSGVRTDLERRLSLAQAQHVYQRT